MGGSAANVSDDDDDAGGAVTGVAGGPVGNGGSVATGRAGAGSGGAGVGNAGSSAGTAGIAGSGGAPPTNLYAPRNGSFKMLVYSKTAGFRHDGSIVTGKAMLQEIASEQGFEVVITETNELITPAALAKFEIVFFMNPSGDVFNDQEQQAYEDWMVAGGAFGGVHTATDTESGWQFYSEVTGQFYDGHSAQNVLDNIQFEPNMLNHPALKGLPNPWQRHEEWMRFNSHAQWTAKPGFQVLGRKAVDAQPIMWLREWGNFRAFYTGIGHDAVVFKDPQVKQHLTGGIMWAVRREHLLK